MFNLKTIGKFNGSKFDKLTSHPAIEEPCYMKFRKVICATYYLRRSLRRHYSTSHQGMLLNGWKYHKVKQEPEIYRNVGSEYVRKWVS